MNIALFVDDGWLADIDRNSSTVLAITFGLILGNRVSLRMTRNLGGALVKFFNGWLLYGTISTVQFKCQIGGYIAIQFLSRRFSSGAV